MIIVRALVAGLNLIVQEASGHPLRNSTQPIHLAAMVPLQLYNTLQEPEEKEKLKAIDKILIGGGNIETKMEKDLQSFPNAIYSTYGMTETLSHIALRKLTNPGSSVVYTPLPGIQVTLNQEGCLEITAPALANEKIKTNDLAELYPDQTFRILGRKDNIINSGGIKIAIEQLEEMYASFIPFPFAATSVSDSKFGEAITLIIQAGNDALSSLCFNTIPAKYKPKQFLAVERIPITGNGKTDRLQCKKLAESYIEKRKKQAVTLCEEISWPSI